MDTSDKALTRKESKHLHSHLSKTVLKQNDLIKKIMPRSGSYSLAHNNSNNQSGDNNNSGHRQAHSNKNYHSNELRDELLNNDHIVLNSAERLDEKAAKGEKEVESKSNVQSNEPEKTPYNKKNNSNEVKKAQKQVEANKKKGSTANESGKFNVSDIDLSLIDFPKKKTILGVPLIFFTYTSAIYSLLAYGATSLLTIIELMMNNSTKLIPLYILLVGYLLITLMSFLLIVAIQREMLNLILFWIIVITVFILPEIGLNVVLAENSLGWFNTASGFYTLVALVVRVTLDIPSIIVILIYHLNRTKRNNYLRKMMLPLKKNIVNGEMLKKYNNLKIDQLINVQYPIIETMPTAEYYLNHYGRNQSMSHNGGTDIGFEKIRKEIAPPPLASAAHTKSSSASRQKQPTNKTKTSNKQEADNCVLVTPEQSVPDLQQTEPKKNVLHYKFLNDSDFDVIVRPSATNDFVQRFVNVDKIKVDRKIQRNAANSTSNVQNNNSTVNTTENTPKKKLLIVKTDITDKSEIKHSNYLNQNTDYYQSSKSLDKAVNEPVEKVPDPLVEKARTAPGKYSFSNVYDRNNNIDIPINRPSTDDDDQEEDDYDDSFDEANGDLHEKYLNMIENRSRMLNVNTHQIYLPPVTSGMMMTAAASEMTKQTSNYNLEASFLRQNYPNDDVGVVVGGGGGTFLSAVDHHYHNTDDRCMFFDDNENDYSPEHLQSAPAAIVNFSPCCNCVNIASCSKDKLNEFLHSNDCHLSRQHRQFHFKSSYPNLLTQRKHF